MLDETAIGGARHRFIAEVREVTGLGEDGRPATNMIFGPAPGEPRAVPLMLPESVEDLVRAGFDPDLMLTHLGRGAWDRALNLKTGGP
jgi:hypothetical protein